MSNKTRFAMEFDQISRTRPETGVVRWAEDWPGVFIRGEDARTMADELEDLLKTGSTSFTGVGVLQGLVSLLRRSDMSRPQEWVLMRQGDDGNPLEFGRYPTRAEAEAKMAELEAGKPHKQVYWVTEVKS